MVGKTLRILLGCMTLAMPLARADGPGRIYTKPAEEDSGVITGKVAGGVLTHALAVERDRKRVYQAALDGGSAGFRFTKLPVGRYDLVLVTTDNRVIEGLGLGTPASELAEPRASHLAAAVARADTFFNRHTIHRAGLADGIALVFVERIRDRQILRGSGEEIDACLRRLEIIELHEASDDWQTTGTRHLFREETPRRKDLPFLRHSHLPTLSGLRLANSTRDLGTIDLHPPAP